MSTDPALQQLAATLTPEAYHAIEPILQGLASRVTSAENTAAAAQQTSVTFVQLQAALQSALSGAQFTVQTPTSSTSSHKPSNLRIELPVFKGNHLALIGVYLSRHYFATPRRLGIWPRRPKTRTSRLVGMTSVLLC